MSKKPKKKENDTTKVKYKTIRPLLTGLQKGEHKHTEVLEATVINVCRAYNITYADIQQFLKNRGFAGIPKNGKITEAHVLNQLDFDFRRHKVEWDSIHSTRFLIGIKANDSQKKKSVLKEHLVDENGDWRMKLENVHQLKQNDVSRQEVREEYTPNLSVTNDIATPTKRIAKNVFLSIKKTIKYEGRASVVSFFSDQQAANICSKMTDSYPRSLANRFDKNGEDQYILYQLHYIANKALQIFGGEVLSFILSLRKLKFRNFQALELKTYYKAIPDFPIITLKTSNKVFKVSFFAKRKHNGNLSRDVRIFDKENVQIGYIDEFGRIESKLEKFKPHLGIFYEITKLGKYELYSGVESGVCEICQRKLDHPLSVRVGIGPTCAVNIGLDRTLYNFSI